MEKKCKETGQCLGERGTFNNIPSTSVAVSNTNGTNMHYFSINGLQSTFPLAPKIEKTSKTLWSLDKPSLKNLEVDIITMRNNFCNIHLDEEDLIKSHSSSF